MSSATAGRARVKQTIGGLELNLKFEAENLMELSRLTGLDPMHFLMRIQKDSKDPREAGMRASDLNVLVPLIAAGLCHHDEYAGLSDRDMRRRICGLIDAEVATTRSSLLMVSAKLVAALLPVFVRSMQGLDDAPTTEGPPGPLGEAETSAGAS